jgi:hypothetical protein
MFSYQNGDCLIDSNGKTYIVTNQFPNGLMLESEQKPSYSLFVRLEHLSKLKKVKR